MNTDFQTVAAASDSARWDLLLGAAARLGTAVQNVEKDFWFCRPLLDSSNVLHAGGHRRLFKDGTSLSMAFGPICRFSGDRRRQMEGEDGIACARIRYPKCSNAMTNKTYYLPLNRSASEKNARRGTNRVRDTKEIRRML